MPGALLMPDQDVPDADRVEQWVVEGQDRAARDAEDNVHAQPLQRCDQRLGTGQPGADRCGRGAMGPLLRLRSCWLRGRRLWLCGCRLCGCRLCGCRLCGCRLCGCRLCGCRLCG